MKTTLREACLCAIEHAKHQCPSPEWYTWSGALNRIAEILRSNDMGEPDPEAIVEALDAERAALLEEVREWLDAYDDQVTQEAEAERWRHHGEYMRSVSDGVTRTRNAFEIRFLTGKEGA